MTDPTVVFSNRVQNYLNYRPRYPAALIDLLRMECHLGETAVVADVGSGTGLLAELFLKHGNRVFGIEPNAEMRTAAENLLQAYPRFTSMAAKAEATALSDHSVDFITAGQAFHWFDPALARQEFARILKPHGWVVVVYNLARTNTPFLAEYHQCCETFLGDASSEGEYPDLITPFFGQGHFTEVRLDGVCQPFDFTGLAGRVLSRASAPEVGHPRYKEMMDTLRSIFDRYQQAGEVTLEYDTQVIYGQLPI